MSKTIQFSTKGQVITALNHVTVIADSINYLYAEFIFDSEWDGIGKTAIFKNGTTVVNVVLAADAEGKYITLVPHEVIKPPSFTVSCFGGDLVTVNKKDIMVEPSGYAVGEAPADPTPSEYEQVLLLMNTQLTDAFAAQAAQAAAELAETHAETAETNAETAETGALAAKAAALAAQEAAELAETNAETAETAAELAETKAKASEVAAALSETNILGKEVVATEQAGIATEQATTATTKAGEASGSAAAALASEQAAALSETAALTAKTNAETAETNAELAETGAQTAQTAAELAETHAETAETNAETAETGALAAKAAAELAETNAETAETNAKTSETNAKTSETNSKTSETNAATSATTALSTKESIITEEATRAIAEEIRNTSETSRANAESTRQTNETGRVDAEGLRAIAETARGKAEGLREPRLTDVESKLSYKLSEPPSGLAVGKYFRIASIDDDGHAVLEAVDAPETGMKLKVAGAEQTPDVDGYVNVPISTASSYGAVKLEGDFELIETITLAEDTAAIERNAELDGTLYNFNKLLVSAEKCGLNKQLNFYNTNYQGDYFNTHATYSGYSHEMLCEYYNGGYVRFFHRSGPENAGQILYACGIFPDSATRTIAGTTYSGKQGSIKAFRLEGAIGALINGTVIKIYGGRT